jgi:tetratricopeptide (TPR) repeat protein
MIKLRTLSLAAMVAFPFWSLHAQDVAPEEEPAATLIQPEAPRERPLDLGSIMQRLANEMPQELDTKLPADYGRSKQEVQLFQLRRKAFALLSEGQTLEAIAAFHEALEIEPDDKNTQFGLGTSLIQNNEYAEA